MQCAHGLRDRGVFFFLVCGWVEFWVKRIRAFDVDAGMWRDATGGRGEVWCLLYDSWREEFVYGASYHPFILGQQRVCMVPESHF